MTTPSEEDLRDALSSVLLIDNNDDECVVDGIDGALVLSIVLFFVEIGRRFGHRKISHITLSYL